jgi:ABC-2 type transport system ATP-binding protein
MPESAIRVTALKKRYDDVVAVDGIDLEVRAGECFGLLGPNGAGKTTTIEILEGLTAPTSGNVEVLGRRWDKRADAAWLRQRIGLALQETHLTERLSVEETLTLFCSFYDQGPTVDDLLKSFSLEEKRKAWYMNLSGGQKQRLAVACALAGDPALLFLDEPTTGLDPQSRRQLWELLTLQKQAGRTLVLTTHYMDEAERLCERVAIVDHGKIIALDTPAALIASLGGDEIIELVANGPLDDAALRALPGVAAVRRVTDSIQLQTGALHISLPALISYVSSAGRQLDRLGTRRATLEDVFVSLTGRHLRD